MFLFSKLENNMVIVGQAFKYKTDSTSSKHKYNLKKICVTLSTTTVGIKMRSSCSANFFSPFSLLDVLLA